MRRAPAAAAACRVCPMDCDDELQGSVELVADVPVDCSSEWAYQMRRKMQEIVPSLFLGPYAAAMKQQEENLKQAGITHIICVRQQQEAKFIRENMPHSFTYLTLDIADSPCENIIRFFPSVCKYISECLGAGGKVLVHGNGGISRSAALVVAYVMHDKLYSASDALKFVQSQRFCVYPNEGFRRQLFEYEPILRASVTAARRGLLPTASGIPKRGIQDVDLNNDDDDENVTERRRI